MNRDDHNKRIDRLFGQIKAEVDKAYEPALSGTEPGTRGRIVRDLIDDALADAYGSGEANERKQVVCFLRDSEVDGIPDSSYYGVSGRKVRQFVLETARELIEAGKHDLA